MFYYVVVEHNLFTVFPVTYPRFINELAIEIENIKSIFIIYRQNGLDNLIDEWHDIRDMHVLLYNNPS